MVCSVMGSEESRSGGQVCYCCGAEGVGHDHVCMAADVRLEELRRQVAEFCAARTYREQEWASKE